MRAQIHTCTHIQIPASASSNIRALEHIRVQIHLHIFIFIYRVCACANTNTQIPASASSNIRALAHCRMSPDLPCKFRRRSSCVSQTRRNAEACSRVCMHAISVNRDLYQRQKRPISVAKARSIVCMPPASQETNICDKRGLFQRQNRPVCMPSAPAFPAPWQIPWPPYCVARGPAGM